MNAKLAVAALAAAAVSFQAAFVHALVAAPLASAVGYAAEPVRPTFEESILVRAVAKAHAPIVHAGG